MDDAKRWQLLREMLGYSQDGSAVAVTISQDDATGGWSVRRGVRTFFGDTLDSALKAAADGI